MTKDFNTTTEKKSQNKSLGNLKKEYELFIESFGVKIRIATNEPVAIGLIYETLQNGLGGRFKTIDKTFTKFSFWFEKNINNTNSLFKNDKKIISEATHEDALSILESHVRITIAEYAAGKVFIHAGAVGWKDFALVAPARSYHGKTSLVAELVKRGAVYYSDEYAVLDKDGFIHPFPKTLSMRGIIDDYKQVEIPVASIGGTAAEKRIPVGMFLLTEYKEKARWKPKILSAGQGIMEILPHTVPVRYNPEFTLKVLNEAANRAIIAKSNRGDIPKFADKILNFFETRESYN